jgi:DNA-binding transcriptional ArsR family regulator
MTDVATDDSLLIALRHPLRRRILTGIAGSAEPISPVQLAGELKEALSNVSYHVRVLAECDAVLLVDTQPVRGSMQHFYRIDIEEPWALAVLGIPIEEGGENDSGEETGL